MRRRPLFTDKPFKNKRKMKIDFKKLWKIARRVLLAALTVSVAWIAAALAIAYYEHRTRNYVDVRLSDHVTVRYFCAAEAYRVYNDKLGKWTATGIDWVAEAPECDSLTVFCKKGKRGYINAKDGRIAIEAQYDKAWVFSEGLGAVMRDGKIGFVDARNEIVLPFRYDYSYRKGWPIDYLFRDGYCTMTDARGACGLIDRRGDWVVEPRYDCIWAPHRGGYRIVKEGDKYGLMDPSLNFLYPIEYDGIAFTDDDEGILLTRDGYRRLVDFEGNVVQRFVTDSTCWLYLPSDEDQAQQLSEFMTYTIDNCVGVLRRDDGSVVIPAIYAEINLLSETLFEAQLYDTDEWIFIDRSGRIVDQR